MTYNIKNATFVIAFAALMMTIPFATGTVFADEIDANLDANCGFSTSALAGLDFGSFTADQDAATVGEQEVQLTPVPDTVASARVSVTVDDWFGVGTRASGTITLASAAVGDTVTIGTTDYDAIAGPTSGTNWDQRGDDIADAAELAAAIRGNEGTVYKVSTAGTNVVTVNTVSRGTAQNTVVLSEDTTGSTIITRDSAASTSTNVLNGAVDTPQLIMDGETTKFDMNVGSTASNTYNNLRSVITLGTAQEVLGGTNPAQNIFFALQIDPASATFSNLPYDGALTQEITVTVESACDGT
ncbi:hypothetical protein [Nitrosopumilus sp.]|uniref:hypothetical protein n=1 Tax=Nitrosopumilus sp. TaxID=2024843 RepID=UPI00247D25B1|nr:hypothetical protein [Nitrosopumilus sp.]MCV0409924.1 hypothetical protein [Nitrosopumilus sp.]